MSAKFALDAFLRLSAATQEHFSASARAKHETYAVRSRLPVAFKKHAKRVSVLPRSNPFFTKFHRYCGFHYGSVKVYCYAISLDVDCTGGEKKTFELALEFWEIAMSQGSGLAGSGNHELNMRYGGMEATAFSGNYSDCCIEEEKMWLSESEKIQDMLRMFIGDCGVDVQGEPIMKKRKVEKQATDDEDGFPDIVDAQCMELLQALLGPSGHKVLKQDTFEPQWTLIKIIQKGRVREHGIAPLRSFLRNTPGVKRNEIDVGEYEREYEEDSD